VSAALQYVGSLAVIAAVVGIAWVAQPVMGPFATMLMTAAALFALGGGAVLAYSLSGLAWIVRLVGIMVALGILVWSVVDFVPALAYFGAPRWAVFLSGAVVGGLVILTADVFWRCDSWRVVQR